MNRDKATAAVAAALLALLGGTGPGVADEHDMLRDQVQAQLSQHDITIENLDALTDTQLMQVALILGTTSSKETQRAEVKTLLSESEPCVGNEQMRAQVAGQLAQHGIVIKNVDMLTGSEVVLLQAVLSSTASREEAAAQIERIFASDSPILGNAQVRADAMRCVQKVGADVKLDALSPEDLMRIQMIAGSSESPATKRQMIEDLADE